MMTAKLKPEVKAEWLAALRSGEYKQCSGALKKISNTETTHCCLGVLCDLHAKKGLGDWQNRDGYTPIDALFVTDYVSKPTERYGPHFCKSFTTLPNPVCDWAGDGTTETNPGAFISVAELKTLIPKIPDKYAGAGVTDDTQVFVALAELNDFGASFETIANFIEKHL